jgi:signal transduction histidine kinase
VGVTSGDAEVQAQPSRAPLVALALLGAYAAVAVAMLSFGVASAAATASPSWHETLHEWGLRPDLPGRTALAMADASHRVQPLGQLLLDYGFSVFNLALAGLLVWLRPQERTALLLATALVGTAAVFNLQAYGVYEALAATRVDTALHLGFQLVAAVSYIYALLLFPDGRLVPRWPRLALLGLYVALTALVAGLAFEVRGTSRTVALIMYFGLLTPLAGVVAQAYRYRRSPTPLERQQARLLFWALTPALLVGLFVLTSGARETAFTGFAGRPVALIPVGLFRVFQPVFALIPLALFVGILRYRLWNIERVISRTLFYGMLAGFVSAVYVGVVVGIGRAVGAQGNNVALSILATGVVAVAFEPVKARVNRFANRLVYGQRATPYEVLSELSGRMAESVPTEELLSKVARIIAEGTGARRADVWLVIGDEARVAATWPDGPAPESAVMAAEELAREGTKIPGASLSVIVRHQGETLGALAVTKPEGEALTPTEEKLLADVGAQAGLVLRNVRLNAELTARLDDLRSSRQRLVAAQDAARRRLERNLHDGAQQQLVALKVMVGLVERMAEEGEPVADLLSEVTRAAGEALENLRDLARGIYPPLLAAEGLPAALKAQAAKVPFAMTVDADGIGRYPQEMEAAVYFCCLEALQNVSKYAGASQVTVTLRGDDGALGFSVADDGKGFVPDTTTYGSGCQNMADRIDALGGTLDIISEVGRGTKVAGRIPCPA